MCYFKIILTVFLGGKYCWVWAGNPMCPWFPKYMYCSADGPFCMLALSPFIFIPDIPVILFMLVRCWFGCRWSYIPAGGICMCWRPCWPLLLLSVWLRIAFAELRWLVWWLIWFWSCEGWWIVGGGLLFTEFCCCWVCCIMLPEYFHFSVCKMRTLSFELVDKVHN